jgi:8-oxo-dGTP pyrophosphatase MutT (NUDIX family)
MKLRPRAEVLIFKDGRVLATRDNGYVCFPGGGIDPGESAVQAAKRECLEEADRVLIACTPAHPPTTQAWTEAYKNDKAGESAWKATYDGGLTHWMTGSSSWKPFHSDPRMRHEDYQDFSWYAPEELLKYLDDEASGDWKGDVEVRRAILKAHITMHEPVKAALYPVLSAGQPVITVSA